MDTQYYDHIYQYVAEIRAMIQHENTLLNARMGWMWALQGLLFSAMAFLWDIHLIPLLIIAAVGIISSVSIGYSCVRASNAIKSLLEMVKKFKDENASFYELPPTLGARAKGAQWLLPWKLLPWVFSLAWSGIIIFRLFFY
ncbi:MAG: hypothetical protein LWX83_08170 [Anaerolineae bacterium]|nr:hypothetical protein [Anaerolineae bacterium]